MQLINTKMVEYLTIFWHGVGSKKLTFFPLTLDNVIF
jgi:hypothetical protein